VCSSTSSADDLPHVSLEFSDKYDRVHAHRYFEKHQSTWSRRLSHWRENQICRKALQIAGEPDSVLDLPCGAGRFWPLLVERQERRVLAADNSPDMIAIAREHQAADVSRRVDAFQTSAFAIDLPDNAVETVFSIRLLHHVEQSEHRLAILREFARVARSSVILSLWVDGNYKAWRRRRLEVERARRGKSGSNRNRFVLDRKQVEHEFHEVGLDIIAHLDFVPRYAMWRTYVLRKRS
jgi:ubiquinone/menaquinone biosynthesis C-methylase UbiE